MSDNTDKPRKAELVKSTSGTVTRIEPSQPTGVLSRLSQFFYSPSREKKRLDAHTEVVKAQTELGEASINLRRTAGRFEDLNNILATDQEQRNSAQLEALKTRMRLENEVDQIVEERKKKTRLEEILKEEQEFELEERLAAIKAKRQRLQEPPPQNPKEEKPLSTIEQLRASVARDTEMDTAREQLLKEARLRCEEKVRNGEMSREDMEHHLSLVKASLSRHTARRP